MNKHKKWDRRFLDLAGHISGWSKDPSTKCGAVVSEGNKIVSIGYNGFPAGVSDCSKALGNREIKYEMVIHAEVNAILHAGRRLEGCSIAVHPFPPCARCAAVIINSGVSKVVTYKPTPDQSERWGKSMEISLGMLKDAGVRVCYLPVLHRTWYAEDTSRLSFPALFRYFFAAVFTKVREHSWW